MEDFEKKIKDRLQNATSSGRVDADDLWSNIEANIKEDTSSRNRVLLWVIAFLFLLTSLSALLYIFNNQESTKSVLNQTVTEDSGSENDKLPMNQNISLDKELETKKEQQKNAIKSELSSQYAKNEAESTNKEKSILKKESKDASTLTKEINLKTFSSSQKDLRNGVSEKVVPNADGVTENGNIVQEKKKKSTLNTEVIKIERSSKAVQTLPGLSIHPFEIEQEAEEVFTIDQVKARKKGKRLSVGLFSGAHVFINNFESSSENELGKVLQESFSPETGFSLSGEASYRINRLISVKTGLEYFQSTERFDYTRTWDTLIWRNDIPNSELIDAEAVRFVRHYNKHTFISIPLMMELNFRKHRLHYGIGLGTSLNFINTQKGRILTLEENVTTFSDDISSDLPKPDFYLAYQLQPFLGYQLTKDISIRLRADVRWQNYSQSVLLDLRQSSLLTGLGLGVIYTP